MHHSRQNRTIESTMLEGTPSLECNILKGTKPLECNVLKGTKPLKRNILDEWLTFRDLWTKGKQSRVEDKDWETFSEQFVRLAGEILHRAEIIAAAPAVVTSETLKTKNFDGVISDDGPLLKP